MDHGHPFLLDDVDRLRREVLGLEASGGGRRAELWRLLKNCARSAPLNFPWFTPFVALMTRDAGDIDNARRVLRAYVERLDPLSFSTGMQFHFWCFAFPHAKWSLYFQWLCTLGAFEPDEAEKIRQQLIAYHFVNFHYGLRTKPEPDCVDNQALSLAFSSALVGALFAEGQGVFAPSAIARRLLDDGLRRLPVVIGDMPASGYSGEGSAYMDCVNGPAVAMAVELLERLTGRRDVLTTPSGAGQGTPLAVLCMVAREWMPGGLLLPWDNYGYQLGVRAPLAFAARRTGEPLFADILEHDAIWSYDIGTGWAYDDLVWTLIWWPEVRGADRRSVAARNWFEPEVGGALVSADRRFYVAQVWDASAPEIPTRAHVNPNAVLFNGFGVPLSADGARAPEGCARFAFPDTVRDVSHLTMGEQARYNYGDGCGGAHSVVLVDRWEGLRMFGEGAQFAAPGSGPDALWCDVAASYAERFPDVRAVRRRSSLHAGRFFVIEDDIRFDLARQVTSRFVLRPALCDAALGVKIRTPEGVTLNLIELLGGDALTTEAVTGFPAKPDGRCVLADFSRTGAQVRRLFVAFIARDLAEADEPLRGFAAVPDEASALDLAAARTALADAPLQSDLQLPPHMERVAPISRRWWYRLRVHKGAGAAWLKLPLGLRDPALWIDGHVIDFAPYANSLDLIGPRVRVPESLDDCAEVELVLRTEVPVSHYEGGGDGTIGLSGGVWLCRAVDEERVTAAHYDGARIHVSTTQANYSVDYALMADASAAV